MMEYDDLIARYRAIGDPGLESGAARLVELRPELASLLPPSLEDIVGGGLAERSSRWSEATGAYPLPPVADFMTERWLREAIRHIDRVDLNDSNTSLLTTASLHYGIGLAELVPRVYNRQSAVEAAMISVVYSPGTRVVWRAAAVLEYCDEEMFKQALDVERTRVPIPADRYSLLQTTTIQGQLRARLDLERRQGDTKAGEVLQQLTGLYQLTPDPGTIAYRIRQQVNQ